MSYKYQEGGSIVDYLKSRGEDSSKSNRKKLAKQAELKGDLSASDNLALLKYLRNKGIPSQSLEQDFEVIKDIGPDGQEIDIKVPTTELVTNHRAIAEKPFVQVSNPRPRTQNPAIRKRVGNSDDNIYAADADKRLKYYADQKKLPIGSTSNTNLFPGIQRNFNGTSSQQQQIGSDGKIVGNTNMVNRLSNMYDNGKTFLSTNNRDNPILGMADGVITAGANMALPVIRTFTGNSRGAGDVVATVLSALPLASRLTPLLKSASFSPELMANLRNPAFKKLLENTPNMSNASLQKLVNIAKTTKNQKAFTNALLEEQKILSKLPASQVPFKVPANTVTYGTAQKIHQLAQKQKTFQNLVNKENAIKSNMPDARKVKAILKKLNNFNPNE